jgi:hypothetical protein
MYVRTREGLGQGLTSYIRGSSSSYIGDLTLSPEAECPGYKKGEIEISKTQRGHLASDVSLHERGLLIADFGVNWRSVKESTKKEKLLKDWLDRLETFEPESYKLRIFGYSDCVGSEKNNRFLRNGRAQRVYELLGKRARSRVIYKGLASLGTYVTDNSTIEGRAKNRGVIIELERSFTFEPEPITAKPPKKEPRRQPTIGPAPKSTIPLAEQECFGVSCDAFEYLRDNWGITPDERTIREAIKKEEAFLRRTRFRNEYKRILPEVLLYEPIDSWGEEYQAKTMALNQQVTRLARERIFKLLLEKDPTFSLGGRGTVRDWVNSDYAR